MSSENIMTNTAVKLSSSGDGGASCPSPTSVCVTDDTWCGLVVININEHLWGSVRLQENLQKCLGVCGDLPEFVQIHERFVVCVCVRECVGAVRVCVG